MIFKGDGETPKEKICLGPYSFFLNISSLKITKTWLFYAKHDAEKIPEQLRSNFKKFQISAFSTMKIVKMALSEGQDLNLTFHFVCWLFWAKIYQTVSLLKSKTLPKHLLNDSKTTF